jgi:Ras-related protein Rab-22
MNIINCKSILIGETGVGKTCIIERFILDDFNKNQISSSGASYTKKTLDFPEYNKSIDLEIWDTAGQEKYRGIAKIFYKEAKIIILVYDITNHKSFDEIKDYWYNQIKENTSGNLSK